MHVSIHKALLQLIRAGGKRKLHIFTFFLFNQICLFVRSVQCLYFILECLCNCNVHSRQYCWNPGINGTSVRRFIQSEKYEVKLKNDQWRLTDVIFHFLSVPCRYIQPSFPKWGLQQPPCLICFPWGCLRLALKAGISTWSQPSLPPPLPVHSTPRKPLLIDSCCCWPSMATGPPTQPAYSSTGSRKLLSGSHSHGRNIITWCAILWFAYEPMCVCMYTLLLDCY